MNNILPILRQLWAAFANSQLGEEGQLVYFRLLQDIPPDELQVVVDQCLADCKFLPTIAEIRERHRKLTAVIDTDTAGEAWASVQKAMLQVGHWGQPKFANPLTAKVVQALGWERLCQSEDHMADRAHFLKMYDAIIARDEQVNRLLPQAREMLEQHSGKPLEDVLSQARRIVAAKALENKETEAW